MRWAAVFAGICLPLAVHGADHVGSPSPEAVKARLAARYPATHIDAVRESGLPGIYELVMGRQIAYVDGDGRYFLFGHIFDLAANRDITEERLQDVSRVDVSAVGPDQVLEDARLPQGRVVYVFSDPGCVHCRELEQSIAAMAGVSPRTILLPLQSGSRALARDLWCAPDRHAAWQGWMLHQEAPPTASADCAAAADLVIDRNLALATRWGIRGTPGLVAADGRIALGARSAESLRAWLTAGQLSDSEVSR